MAGITTAVVREAQERHALAPTASAAVGRLITGAALLGASLQGRERLTLQINGDGPVGAIVADAWSGGSGVVTTRAYARNPHADVPLNERGKFDVAGVIGAGMLQVTKSYEVGQPYNGIVPLESGEIGDDIASYLLNSQQIPSVVALGVLANPSGIVAAGGVIAQLMPGADDATIATLEANAQAMPSVTALISGGADPAAMLRAITASLEIKIFNEYTVEFGCRCTREKVEIALLGLGRDELEKMASEQPSTEATCDFCKRQYVLSATDVEKLVARLDG
ncbi:MAG: redox-regulated molecular chaperone HslO [Candidatus Velthaea sp.]